MSKAIVKEEIISKLKKIIKTNRGVINPNEAISKTGYSKDDIISGLNRLIELFEARVVLDDVAGGLRYIFKYPLWQRGKRTAKEILTSIGRGVLKVVKTIYKGAVGVILIAYTIIFAIVLLVLSGNNNDNDSGAGIGMLFRIISEIFFWNAVSRPYYINEDRYGNKYRTYQQKEEKKGTGFIKGVFSFVFGPEIPPIEEEADVREVAAYVRLKTNGIITAANMIELAGISYEKAESRLAEYCGKFDGFLDITNDGTIYGNFSNIMGSTSQSEHQNITYYIDEIEPPIEFTGNKSSRNLGIICMNALNMVMSLVILQMHNKPPVEYFNGELVGIWWELIYGGFGFWLGWFPLLVSTSYFAIPIIRYPSFLIKKKNRNNRVLHKILIGNICKARQKSFTLSELVDITKTKMDANEDKVRDMMYDILRELAGTMEIKEDGTILYTFERLYNEFNLR
jgi:hypothetical protein